MNFCPFVARPVLLAVCSLVVEHFFRLHGLVNSTVNCSLYQELKSGEEPRRISCYCYTLQLQLYFYVKYSSFQLGLPSIQFLRSGMQKDEKQKKKRILKASFLGLVFSRIWSLGGLFQQILECYVSICRNLFFQKAYKIQRKSRK